jgi:hypothetical protein
MLPTHQLDRGSVCALHLVEHHGLHFDSHVALRIEEINHLVEIESTLQRRLCKLIVSQIH